MVLDSFFVCFCFCIAHKRSIVMTFTTQTYGWYDSVMQKHFNNLSKVTIKERVGNCIHEHSAWGVFLFFTSQIRFENYEEWPVDVYYKFSVRFRPKQDACVIYNFGSNDVYHLIFYLSIFCFVISSDTLLLNCIWIYVTT
jgi:hypothetical protein